MSAPTADNKQTALITVVAKAQEPLVAKVDKLALDTQKALAALTVTSNALTSRLAEIAAQLAETKALTAAVKDGFDLKMAEAPLPARELKTGARASRAGSSKKSSQFTNIMTFFRWAAKTNYDGAREKWLPATVVAKHENNPALKKLESSRDLPESDWWSRLAHLEWKALSQPDRDEVRKLFDSVKEGEKAGAGAQPADGLNGDAAAEEAAF